MLTMSWDAIVSEAMLGDGDALRLMPEEHRGALRHARALYRDGSTPDEVIADMFAPVAHALDRLPPIRLH